MDQQVKRLWVVALRSGKYVQTQVALRVGDTYCVLGVLCDQYPDGKWVVVNHEDEDGNVIYEFNTSRADTFDTYFPPEAVISWAGINDVVDIVAQEVMINDAGVSLLSLNDYDNNLSFLELADLIDWGF